MAATKASVTSGARSPTARASSGGMTPMADHASTARTSTSSQRPKRARSENRSAIAGSAYRGIKRWPRCGDRDQDGVLCEASLRRLRRQVPHVSRRVLRGVLDLPPREEALGAVNGVRAGAGRTDQQPTVPSARAPALPVVGEGTGDFLVGDGDDLRRQQTGVGGVV